mgnify:CR=1 FL=1
MRIGIGLNDIAEEAEIEAIFLHHGEFVQVLDLEGYKEGPFGFLVDIATRMDAENFGDLEKDAPGAWGIVCAVVESVVKTLVCSALEWVSLPSGGR